jgi:hypothetical protein
MGSKYNNKKENVIKETVKETSIIRENRKREAAPLSTVIKFGEV